MVPKRDRNEAFFSPSKANKKAKVVSSAEADAALESEGMKKMLADPAIAFQSMGAYASGLMDKDINEKDPKVILKTLMCEGWIDTEGRIKSKRTTLPSSGRTSRGSTTPRALPW